MEKASSDKAIKKYNNGPKYGRLSTSVKVNVPNCPFSSKQNPNEASEGTGFDVLPFPSPSLTLTALPYLVETTLKALFCKQVSVMKRICRALAVVICTHQTVFAVARRDTQLLPEKLSYSSQDLLFRRPSIKRCHDGLMETLIKL